MSAIQAVSMSFLGIAFLLAWMAFKMNEAEKDLMIQYVGKMFLSFSIAFMWMTAYMAVQVAENNMIEYMTDGVVVSAMWVMSIAAILFTLWLLLKTLMGMAVYMSGGFMEWIEGRESEKEEEGF